MPLDVPSLDDRRFQDLLDEALARAATHNPEWTNFQTSDPGVTILESFAFLVETLLYRANRIPERDRAKFLTLLGIPLAPARAARTLVVFARPRVKETVSLAAGVRLAAQHVEFLTESALDVLGGESRVVVKRTAALSGAQLERYNAVFATLGKGTSNSGLVFYELAPLPADGIDLAETADGAIWLALLAPKPVAPDPVDLKAARAAWAGKTLGLGLAPRPTGQPARDLPAGGAAARAAGQSGGWEVALAGDAGNGTSSFQMLRLIRAAELRDEPAAYEVPLPPDLANLAPPVPADPFDQGTGQNPPKLAAEEEADRVAVWLRLRPTPGAFAAVAWAGVNAVAARQAVAVRGEFLGTGDGTPDQAFKLSRGPVAPGSLRIRVGEKAEEWAEIDDLLAAGPQTPRGVTDADPNAPSRVFACDPEAGVVRFGDGQRGARPATDATVRADYEVSAGKGGNVGAGQLQPTADIPSGIDATNPLAARGGGDAQTPADAETLIPRAVRHRDRLVTAEDYRDIVLSAPGAGVGRVEVLPLYSPLLGGQLPGDVAGAVTLLLIPRADPARPDAPTPTTEFLDAVCAHLDPKRPVTAEVYLRGPEYVGLAVSVGYEPQPGFAAPDVRDRLAAAIRAFLSPLPADPPDPNHPDGWPLEKAVNPRELLAVASRVRGVRLIYGVEVAVAGVPPAGDADIRMRGLQLPRLDRLSVAAGPPVPVADLSARIAATMSDTARVAFPVPIVAKEC